MSVTLRRLFIAIAGIAVALPAPFASAQEKLTPSIWIDPDGCEHWVIDDGGEGYMSPHLKRDGTPVCHQRNVCGVLETDLIFAFNSDRVTTGGRTRVLRVFRESPARAYIVTGHTDNTGSDEYNMALSERRAKSVAAIGRQIGAPIIDVLAYGERRPRSTNQTERGRRDNRRVEIQCLK